MTYPFFCFRVSPTHFSASGCHLPIFLLQGVTFPPIFMLWGVTHFCASGCHLPIFVLQGVTYTLLCFRVSAIRFSASGCHLPIFLLQGVTYPSIHAIWAKWAPPQEKTKLATFAFAGEWVEGLHPYSVSMWAGVGAPILSGWVSGLGWVHPYSVGV